MDQKILEAVLNIEKFKKIVIDGEDTKYWISSHGRVVCENYRGCTDEVKVLKDRKSNNGYHVICLSHNNHKYIYLIHRLVAEYFIPNIDNLKYVNHIDGNKDNNNISNLEWISAKDNSIHAANNGLIKIGEKSRLARISNDTAMKICEALMNNIPFDDIAKMYDTTYNTVYDIYRHKSWKQLTKDMDFSKYSADKRYINNTKICSTTNEQ